MPVQIARSLNDRQSPDHNPKPARFLISGWSAVSYSQLHTPFAFASERRTFRAIQDEPKNRNLYSLDGLSRRGRRVAFRTGQGRAARHAWNPATDFSRQPIGTQRPSSHAENRESGAGECC